jgi:hypothetical protein
MGVQKKTARVKCLVQQRKEMTMATKKKAAKKKAGKKKAAKKK